MAKRRGIVTTLFIALFCIFIGLGIIWYFLSHSLDSTSSYFLGQYPSGVYDTNNLSLYNFVRYAYPFFALISIMLFVYISIKRRNQVDY